MSTIQRTELQLAFVQPHNSKTLMTVSTVRQEQCANLPNELQHTFELRWAGEGQMPCISSDVAY